MTRICYIIGQLDNGGAEKQLYELVKGINKDLFDPVVISLSQGGSWSREFRKLDIKVIELQRRKHREFARLFRLFKLLKAIRPDLVHTYLFSANSYGRIAAILAKVPIIIASERNLPEIGKDKERWWMYVDKALAFFSDAIICNSYQASQSLIDKYLFEAKKIFTVHNGIAPTYFLKEGEFISHTISDHKVIGTIGRLYPQKNHKLFLDMAKIILESHNKCQLKFMLVGNGVLRDELESYAQQLGIKNQIIFAGERSDIANLLQSMDVFVMTSLYEGLSNAIMEAMLAGLPVVATNVGGNNELISDGETGFLCPSNDAMVLAKRVIMLVNNDKESKRMGRNGRKKILNEFGIHKMIKMTEKVYLDILKQKNMP